MSPLQLLYLCSDEPNRLPPLRLPTCLILCQVLSPHVVNLLRVSDLQTGPNNQTQSRFYGSDPPLQLRSLLWSGELKTFGSDWLFTVLVSAESTDEYKPEDPEPDL